jgi:hypothetical protein
VSDPVAAAIVPNARERQAYAAGLAAVSPSWPMICDVKLPPLSCFAPRSVSIANVSAAPRFDIVKVQMPPRPAAPRACVRACVRARSFACALRLPRPRPPALHAPIVPSTTKDQCVRMGMCGGVHVQNTHAPRIFADERLAALTVHDSAPRSARWPPPDAQHATRTCHAMHRCATVAA